MKVKLATLMGILPVLVLCMLTGCNTAEPPLSDTTPEPSTTVPQPIETTGSPESSPPPDNNVIESDTSNDNNAIESDTGNDNSESPIVMRGSVESICTPERVHNITCATYVGYEVSDGGNLILLFNTVKNHVGLDMSSQFKAIYFPEDAFSTDPSDIVYEQGKSYLLLLHRYRNVYADSDEFQITCGSLVVPTEDLQSSTMNNAPLARSVKGMKITEATTLDQFVDYLKELTADHPDFSGQDYIQTDAKASILAQSPHVVTVTTSSVTSNMSVLTVTLRCRIDAVHKGTLTEGDYIDVMFPLSETIQMNQSIILTLNDPIPGGMDWYVFSCKNAMYPVSEADRIQALIQEQEAAN